MLVLVQSSLGMRGIITMKRGLLPAKKSHFRRLSPTDKPGYKSLWPMPEISCQRKTQKSRINFLNPNYSLYSLLEIITMFPTKYFKKAKGLYIKEVESYSPTPRRLKSWLKRGGSGSPYSHG